MRLEGCSWVSCGVTVCGSVWVGVCFLRRGVPPAQLRYKINILEGIPTATVCFPHVDMFMAHHSLAQGLTFQSHALENEA